MRGVYRWLPPVLLLAALAAAWELGVRMADADPILLPGPLRVIDALWTARAEAVRHLVPTLVETGVGLVASVAAAVAVTVALDRIAWLRRAVEPLLIASQAIPVVAVAPLFVVWFGFGLAPKVVVVVLVTFFPIAVGLLDGFRSGSPESAELFRSFAATPGQTFRRLRWPVAMPSLFTGLRVAAVYAVIGAVFGEYVGATEGLGIWMQVSQNAFRTDLVFGAVVLAALVSMTLYAVVAVLERALVPWSPRVRGGNGTPVD
jgi:NitT/TauT family transport system permease protein